MVIRLHNFIFLLTLFIVSGISANVLAQNPIAPCPTEKERKSSASMVVEFDKPFVSTTLMGVIKSSNGETVKNVVIERLIPNSETCIESTKTDSNGRFNFPNLPKGKYYLRISKFGFSTSMVRIIIRNKSKQNELELPIQRGI